MSGATDPGAQSSDLFGDKNVLTVDSNRLIEVRKPSNLWQKMCDTKYLASRCMLKGISKSSQPFPLQQNLQHVKKVMI